MNKVSEEYINCLLDDALVEYKVFFGKCMVCCYKLPNGFTVTGECACVDPDNFHLGLGLELCREEAKKKLWTLEGYLLQQRLFDEANKPELPVIKTQSKLETVREFLLTLHNFLLGRA